MCGLGHEVPNRQFSFGCFLFIFYGVDGYDITHCEKGGNWRVNLSDSRTSCPWRRCHELLVRSVSILALKAVIDGLARHRYNAYIAYY
jgi:hypothetical protein